MLLDIIMFSVLGVLFGIVLGFAIFKTELKGVFATIIICCLVCCWYGPKALNNYHNDMEAQYKELYNHGHCDCGGEWKFSNVVERNERMYNCYHCNDCQGSISIPTYIKVGK